MLNSVGSVVVDFGISTRVYSSPLLSAITITVAFSEAPKEELIMLPSMVAAFKGSSKRCRTGLSLYTGFEAGPDTTTDMLKSKWMTISMAESSPKSMVKFLLLKIRQIDW